MRKHYPKGNLLTKLPNVHRIRYVAGHYYYYIKSFWARSFPVNSSRLFPPIASRPLILPSQGYTSAQLKNLTVSKKVCAITETVVIYEQLLQTFVYVDNILQVCG